MQRGFATALLAVMLGCAGPDWPAKNPYAGETGPADGWPYAEWMIAASCCDALDGVWGAYFAEDFAMDSTLGDYAGEFTKSDCVGYQKWFVVYQLIQNVPDSFCVDAELADACIEWMQENIDSSCSVGIDTSDQQCGFWALKVDCVPAAY